MKINLGSSIIHFGFGAVSKPRKPIRGLKPKNLPAAALGVAAISIFLLSARTAHAVPLTTGADFLLMTTGARPDGMGQAFSAVADDINTLSFNPAGLGNIRLPEAGYGYESFIAGIGYDFAGAAIPMGDAGVLGLGYIDMGTAPFNSTADPAAATSSAMDRAFIAGWGRSFYDLHLGFAAKYITRRLDNLSGDGFAFDLGLRYRVLPTLTLAASVLNLGPDIHMPDPESLPTVANLGAAWTLVEEPLHSLTVAVNGALCAATNTQQLGFGAEYWYRGQFALRAGYLADSLDRTLNSDGFSAGAGVKVSFFQLDYAFQPFNTLGMVHRVSGILRWDGPWVPGGEPNAPPYVSAQATARGIEVRWEKPQGPVQAYRVSIQPLDGGAATVTPPLPGPPYLFKAPVPGTLYKIWVVTLNGGTSSFPSAETYVLAPVPSSPESRTARVIGFHAASESRGVRGRVDAVGLQLSWDPVPGAEGYRLYRQSPSGRVEKACQGIKYSNRLWVTDVSGLAGWKWIVSAVQGSGEKVAGTFLWAPSPAEEDLPGGAPEIRLHASPEPGREIFLDWDRREGAAGYSLFVSDAPDGVYELYKDFGPGKATALLKVLSGRSRLYFLMAPQSPGGGWLTRSNPVTVEGVGKDVGN